ncbi:hypothetical protein KMW28_05035 [Flammeovirga yaeyamensis]|uniref:Uncharacterized protein n=1 Tax=Flammeovirga yaeyamensis TaxID=367791 RepID=A0AAX1N6Q2_9BACT|nr:hypothetical protein [Flammeovirga yaeyamensis]MBB3697523.1 hypothetical protein [Flammeovirga yaeyamensis]NMF36217.1 hypothetical protein [Flammeovirga yaeyamensis]QWG02946.1 hypothetical protein KMW28_05035 [Flammeovirga yaeyamensis]
MKKTIYLLVLFIITISCTKNEVEPIDTTEKPTEKPTEEETEKETEEPTIESWKKPYFDYLVGSDNKMWLLDKGNRGHIAIGPGESYEPTWWVCEIDEFEGRGVYDDQMSFSIEDSLFSLINNQSTLVFDDSDQKNRSYYDSLGGKLLIDENNHITYEIDFPNTNQWKWDLYKEDDKVFLDFKNGAFPIYHRDLNLSYEITLLNENELELRALSNNKTLAHYFIFKRDGYTRPDVSTEVKQALLAIYNEMDGPNWNEDHDFNSDKPVREWRNLKVDNNGKLISLNLSGKGLKGNIPSSISHLKDLKFLYLNDNEITQENISLIGNLDSLEILDLSNNRMEGTLPTSFSQLSKLITLKLSYNQFSGVIPNEWSNLLTLNNLLLNDNQLEGEIPSYLLNFEEFWSFKIENNNFSGVIPKDLFDKLKSYAPWNEFTYDEKNDPYKN